MSSFFEDLKKNEERLQEIASSVVKYAKENGADECEVSVGGVKGLSVSSRDMEVENIEYNKDNGLDVTVYLNKKRGNASTTDLSADALHDCVKSAISIAGYSNEDPCAGVADKDLICTEFKELDLVFENDVDADFATDFAISLEKEAKAKKANGIKKSDGASFDSTLYTGVIANSNGFCHARSQSSVSSSIVLLGESYNKMQRGSGYTIARELKDLYSKDQIVDEAIRKTLSKLNAKSVPTGKYNVIFSEGAAVSLWQIFAGAISGGALYRRSSFLCDKLNEQIFPEYVTIHEDPFIKKSIGARCYDADGVRVSAADIIKKGVLQEYLLGTYSARKLNLKSNGHASGIHNWFISFGADREYDFDALLNKAGEGIVITDLMGQGMDMVSGNYSRGAAGYYFKDGKFVHAVDEITIAGNLKDMFMNMDAIGKDIDERYKIKTGSILIPNMTVSGQ